MEPAVPGSTVTLKDVAVASGVSISTASRALDERTTSRSASAAHVRKIAEKLGYRRNSAARALVTRRTRTLGVIAVNTALYGPASTLTGLEAHG